MEISYLCRQLHRSCTFDQNPTSGL